MQSEQPEYLVRQFARIAGLGNAGELSVMSPKDPASERRFFASFSTDGKDWFAGLLEFPGGTVLASSNCATGDAATCATGERIVASIAPLP